MTQVGWEMHLSNIDHTHSCSSLPGSASVLTRYCSRLVSFRGPGPMDGLPLLDIDCIWHYGEKLATCDRTPGTQNCEKPEKVFGLDNMTRSTLEIMFVHDN